MSATTAEFYYTQLLPLPWASWFARPLTGRTVLLTGGNVGLGFEAAKHLASMGPARLIITSRSASKGAEAVKAIELAGRGKVGKVECWELDQSRFESVTKFCDRFGREGGKLDLVILNAGVAQRQYELTPDGWELMLQVNHLSTCLLAIRLLPFLLSAKADPPSPRMVIVNSGLHHRFPDVPEANEEGMLKLLSMFNVLFTSALSERLPPGSPLGVHSVNPGLCWSQLARRVPHTWQMWAYKMLVSRSTEAGSRTLVHAAVGKDLDGRKGEYVESCRVGVASALVRSARGKVIWDKLWAETIEELSKVDPEVPKIVKQYLA